MRFLFSFVHRPTQDRGRALIWPKDVEHDANGRRLARAVGTEETKDRAAFDGKGYIHYGSCFAKRLGEV